MTIYNSCLYLISRLSVQFVASRGCYIGNIYCLSSTSVIPNDIDIRNLVIKRITPPAIAILVDFSARPSAGNWSLFCIPSIEINS